METVATPVTVVSRVNKSMENKDLNIVMYPSDVEKQSKMYRELWVYLAKVSIRIVRIDTR